jgi:4-alpha-glucanotransferase
VHVDFGGADAWTLQDELAGDVRAGAPPDAFDQHGQDGEQLPAVLAPEAERADAVVVGEDLGTTHRRPPRPVPSWPLPASSPTTCPSPRAGGRTWRCDGKPRGRSAATPADAVGDLRQPHLAGTDNEYPNWLLPLAEPTVNAPPATTTCIGCTQT